MADLLKFDQKKCVIIRTTGEIITKDRMPTRKIAKEINAKFLDFVTLTRTFSGECDVIMAVDDWGHIEPVLPVNEIATKLYHAVCIIGTTHEIRGDVMLIHDQTV